MNLYLISQEHNSGYDTFDSAVVAAKSEGEAKKINPCEWDDTWPADKFYYWAAPEYVTVEFLGKTEKEAGIILASFNAG